MKNKHEEDKQLERAAASAEEALKDKDKALNDMQRVLKETETRARGGGGGARAEESTRPFPSSTAAREGDGGAVRGAAGPRGEEGMVWARAT